MTITKEEAYQKIEGFEDQIEESGVPTENVIQQIQRFEKGFPPIKIKKPCTVGDGIKVIDESEHETLLEIYSLAASAGRAQKFVPASGAASRMFRALSALQALGEPLTRDMLEENANQGEENYEFGLTFFNSLKKFAFYSELKSAMAEDDFDLDSLFQRGDYQPILEYLLTPKGLNYANLPKGLIIFHAYPNGDRTAFEEQLVEAIAYTEDSNYESRVHFTVSPEYRDKIKNYVEYIKKKYENKVTLFVEYSVQKKSTQTIAYSLEHDLFVTSDGNLVFRPGGHGALIENLDDLNGDIVFIKNIDNVVPDYLKPETYLYKRLLGGYLVQLQDQIFDYLKKLENEIEDSLLEEITNFADEKLHIVMPDSVKAGGTAEKIQFLRSKLNRPIRVCGMVKNQGEPGGGPFWVEDDEGNLSLQIVEKAQIDLSDPEQREILEQSTHFNPVDLVCGLRDYTGEPFDLSEFIDEEAGIITEKSLEGKPLKAMELPGLWNGSMAFWNTIFVEVPLITFNPVKTVNDLLRDEHQSEKQFK